MATVQTQKATEIIYPHTCGLPNDSLEFDATYKMVETYGQPSNKQSPSEWRQTNFVKFSESSTQRDNASHSKLVADDVILVASATSQKVQNENTKKLTKRLKDINDWKSELNKQISEMIVETDLLLAQKKRLENSLRATEIPLFIATDNVQVRQRRQEPDLVLDEVEVCLLKEIEVIEKAQELLRRTISEANAQVKSNRDEKQNLEMDWSDKKEASELETFCANLRNEHTCKQFYPEAVRYQDVQSTPESWIQYTEDNLASSEKVKQASVRLRALIDKILNDVSRDIKEAADATGAALRKRVDELQQTKARLENELKQMADIIITTENTIKALKEAIKSKDDPLKVAQTRLHKREFRPNVELTRDPAHHGLIDEVHILENSIKELREKQAEAEGQLRALQEQRMLLEKEISVKKNSLFIDREKVMTHRTRYPTVTQLQGY